MKPAYIILLFFLVTPLLAAVPVSAESNTWTDTTWDLMPGYTIAVSLHSEYAGMIYSFVATQPAVKIGGLKMQVEWSVPWSYPASTPKAKLAVYYQDKKVAETDSKEAVKFGSGSIDWLARIKCDCNGYCNLLIDGKKIYEFHITGPQRIYILEDTAKVALWTYKGTVKVSTEGNLDCNNNSGGQQTTTTQGHAPPGNNHQNAAKYAAIGAGALGLGGLIVAASKGVIRL